MDVNKLPQELGDLIQQTYFLHLLATEPDLVVPQGKSLLSMMTQAHLRKTEPLDPLRDRVEKAVHSAFWKQALESLSDPTPSVQLERLKGLHADVREAILPLFPVHHPILATLSAPVGPTASPLVSTTLLLKDILTALRHRAAPARDQLIDALIADLDTPLSPAVTPSTPSSIKSSTSRLAQLIINTVKSIVSLAHTMKADLSQIVIGSMTETQLRAVIVQQAKTREQNIILDIWGDSEKNGKRRLVELWDDWVNALDGSLVAETSDRWIHRLVQALGSTEPVSCHIPRVDSNEPNPNGAAHANQLPPQFFFTAPRLLYAQNYLQALVVVASLRSLTRLPPSAQSDSSGHDFMQRVWALLKAEIDEDNSSSSSDGTKIINLADEVIRARRLVSTPDAKEEAQLRAAVDRTLQYGDPVFLLLQKRLLEAFATRLCELRVGAAPAFVPSNNAPERMQTGRLLDVERAGKRPRLIFDGEMDAESSSTKPALRPMPLIKGFEDPILVRGIEDVLSRVDQHIVWTSSLL